MRLVTMTLKDGTEIRLQAVYYPRGKDSVDPELTNAADRVAALLGSADDGEVFEKAPEVIMADSL